jgi:molybdopterin/thiamine biosynthesis adenylyltransferase
MAAAPEATTATTPTTGAGRVVPPELPDDPFDRQRCIEGWQQDLVESQCALLLGVGGLGCGIALTLARLGVGRLILVDRDVVDVTNLNRQLLFSRTSVGQSKVAAAAEGIKPHLISPHTQVETHHMDVLEHWDQVIALARQATVIFNNIDIGGYFDFAVISLAKALGGRPVGAGSSYARSWIVEYFSGKPGYGSFSYSNTPGDNQEALAKLQPDQILTHQVLTFCPKDDNPPTRTIGSNALVCTSASVMTVNAWLQSLLGADMPNYTKFDLVSFPTPDDTIAWGQDMFLE